MLFITSARYCYDFITEVDFNDGRAGCTDLSSAVTEGVFESLQGQNSGRNIIFKGK